MGPEDSVYEVSSSGCSVHFAPFRQPVRAQLSDAAAARLVASAQQHINVQQLAGRLSCKRFWRFGKMGRNFSIDLRRFRWQAQKASFLANFIR